MSDAPVWPASNRAYRAAASGPFWLVILVVYSALYTLSVAHSLQGGDSSELLVVASRGGVPHPPGYPLYLLMARAANWMPLLNPTLALSLLSTFCALGALSTFRRALIRWELDPVAASVAVAVFGVTPPFWRYAGVPEVFALNAWLVAAMLWAAGRGEGPRGRARALLIGLIAGLGLSNHHTIALLLPVVLAGLWRAVREVGGWRRASSSALLALLGLVLGLTPYLTLLGPVRDSGWYWGGGLTWSGLFDHMARSAYGTLSLGHNDMGPALLENTAAYFARLPAATGLLLPFIAWGAVAAARTLPSWRSDPDDAVDAGALLSSSILVTFVFFELVNLRPVGLASQVLARFYILADLVACGLGAVGLARLLAWRHRLADYLQPLAIGMVCALVLVHVNDTDWSQDYAVEDYVLNALDSTEPGSVIVGTGELQLFGFLAASEVLAHRTDVSYVDLNLLRTRWYYEQVRERLPSFDLPFDALRTSSAEVVAALADDVPVYLADVRVVPELEPWLVPTGPLLRVLQPGETLATPDEAERLNRSLFRRFRFRGRRPHDPTSWSATAYWYYERTWRAIAGLYERFSFPGRAAQMLDIARYYDITE